MRQLDPAFRAWNIEPEVAQIRAPVLAIQGCDDEYGTLAQIRGIAQRVPHTRLLELPEQTVVLTGTLPSLSRDQAKAMLEAAGAKVELK